MVILTIGQKNCPFAKVVVVEEVYQPMLWRILCSFLQVSQLMIWNKILLYWRSFEINEN